MGIEKKDLTAISYAIHDLNKEIKKLRECINNGITVYEAEM